MTLGEEGAVWNAQHQRNQPVAATEKSRIQSDYSVGGSPGEAQHRSWSGA